jgi:hypothetical protein
MLDPRRARSALKLSKQLFQSRPITFRYYFNA